MNNHPDQIYAHTTGNTNTGNQTPAPFYNEKPADPLAPPPPGAHEPSYHETTGQPMYHQDPNLQAQQQQQFSQQQQQQQAQFKTPPPGFQQQQQQQQPHGQPTTVVINPAQLQRLQRYPDTVFCPRCGATDRTRTEYRSGGTTHLAALVACFIACLGCIPYLITSLKDAEHYCGHCGTLLAVWHRSGHTEVVAGGGPANVPVPANNGGGAPVQPQGKYA